MVSNNYYPRHNWIDFGVGWRANRNALCDSIGRYVCSKRDEVKLKKEISHDEELLQRGVHQ